MKPLFFVSVVVVPAAVVVVAPSSLSVTTPIMNGVTPLLKQ